jgi:DNA polymerase-3 subunit delta
MLSFLYGADAYSVFQDMKTRKQNFIAEYGEVNCIVFTGDTLPSLDILQSECNMPGFMGSQKMIVMKDVLVNKPSKPFLEGYKVVLQKIKDDADIVLLLVELGDTFDKRMAVFKFLKKHGDLKHYDTPDPASLRRWLDDQIATVPFSLDSKAKQAFIESFAEIDYWQVMSSFEKLRLYAVGNNLELITADHVALAVPKQTAVKVFDFLETLFSKRIDASLRLLQQLFDQGENEYALLSMVLYQLQVLIMLNALSQETNDYKTIASKSKLHPFVVKKTLSRAKRFTPEILQDMLVFVLKKEHQAKTTQPDMGQLLCSIVNYFAGVTAAI